MQHALALLRGQRTPVARVAEACGYRTKPHLPQLSRHFGMRPKDVRRNLRS